MSFSCMRGGEPVDREKVAALRAQVDAAAEKYCDCALSRMSEIEWRRALAFSANKQHTEELRILAAHLGRPECRSRF